MNKLIRGRRHAQRAAWFEILSKDYGAAIVQYNSAILHMEEALQVILRRIRRYGARLDMLRRVIPTPDRWGDVHIPVPVSTTAEIRYVCEIEGVFLLGRQKGRCVDVDTPNVIRLAAQLLQKRRSDEQQQDKSVEEPFTSVLLSGPAATGKCCLVRALSLCIRMSTVYYVSLPDFLPRRSAHEVDIILRGLLIGNDERRPMVLVLDHVDELCRAPTTEAARTVLCHVEYVSAVRPSGVRIVGITNTPWNLSPKTQAAFQRRLYLPLPNYGSRIEIAQHLLSGSDGYATDILLEDLAAATVNFTSSELAMCLRSPFAQAENRQRLGTRLQGRTASYDHTYSCCAGVEESSMLSTTPDQSVSSFHVTDCIMRAAIGLMTKNLMAHPRPQNPFVVPTRLKSLSNLAKCNIS